jgi:glycosyltransferase involved in cell wall biosynthesis
MSLRIAYLCGTMGWGGLEMNQVRNATWMQNRGHSVQIYALKNNPIKKSAKENNVSVIEIQAHKNHYDFLRALQLYKELKFHRIEHLIVRATFDMSIAASIAYLSRGKIKVHFFMEMDFGTPKKQFFRTWRYSFFSTWNCPLEYLKKRVESNTNIDRKKINVIPSGLEIENIIPINKHEARLKMNLPIDEFVFGIVGRIHEKKGQHLVLEAMLKCNFKHFHLCIVGGPTANETDSYFNELISFVKDNELQERVHFLPFQTDVTSVYSALDWMILPSDSETFGMVTIESMACGIPVLGSNAGGTTELITDGKNGLLFTTKNNSDLAQKMDLILEQQLTFNKEEIKSSILKFDHHAVCEMVEKLLLS